MASGIVAADAASIDVPVLIGVGERDTCPDPHAEPSVYSRSRDVGLFIMPGMAHMHNFVTTCELLWQHTANWAERLASARPASGGGEQWNGYDKLRPFSG
jgi:pimeloyl-ACP methyl ester carboxylesterase